MASAGYSVSSSQDGYSLATNPTLWKPSHTFVLSTDRRVPVASAGGPSAVSKNRAIANSKLNKLGCTQLVSAKLNQTAKGVCMSTRPVVSVLKVVTGGRVPLSKQEAKIKLATLIAWSDIKPEVSQLLQNRLQERYNHGKTCSEETSGSMHSSPMDPYPLHTRMSDIITP